LICAKREKEERKKVRVRGEKCHTRQNVGGIELEKGQEGRRGKRTNGESPLLFEFYFIITEKGRTKGAGRYKVSVF